MAERRMFAKTIIDSDAFLEMPLSAQALYFHLSMRADDEGFINSPKKVQRMLGASDDDLKLLIAKSFIIPFDSGIVVIKHWRIHNYIQNDRFKKTVYTEERDMLKVKENKAYTLTVNAPDTECIQNGYIVDTQDRLGKDRLVEDSKDSLVDIVSAYNETCKSMPKVTKLTQSRKDVMRRMLKKYSIDEIKHVFIRAEKSDFLSGRNGKWSGASFDWLLKESNFVKVSEGNYDNKGARAPTPDRMRVSDYCIKRGITLDLDKFLDHLASGMTEEEDWRDEARLWAKRSSVSATRET